MASPPEEVSKTVSPRVPPQWEPPVTCVLCSEELKDPYLLACLHCLCRECLPRAANEDGRLKCPAPNCGDCSTTWQQPDVVALPRCEERARAECVPVQCATVGKYVEGRKIVRKVASGERISCGNTTCENPTAEATVFCSNCWLFFCGSCEKGHKWMESIIGKHDMKPLVTLCSGIGEHASHLRKAVPLCCPHHKGKVLEYHCEVCDLLMCQACTVDKDSPHRPAYLSAEGPLPPQHLHATKLAQKVAGCSKEQCRIAKEMAEGWGTEGERKKEEALRDVQQSFQAYYAMLDHRKELLCEKIRSVSEARKESITDTVRLYHQKEDTLSNKQAMLSFLSTEGSQHEVISYRRVVNAGPTHRRSEAAMSRVMQFLPKQEAALQAAIEGFGSVEVGACPASCMLEPAPEKLRKYSEKDPIVLTLTTVDRECTPCSVGGESVQAFLRPRPPHPGPSIKAAVADEENGQYKLTFDLTYTGKCELSVLVNGTHIQGSPFAVELNPETDVHLLLTRDVSTLGACKGTLQFPQPPGKLWGLAVVPNGTIFVTDHDNHKIHVFDVERKFVKSIGGRGDGDGQLNYPRGITITTEDFLYVLSINRIDVLRGNGVFVRRIGAGKLKNPWDITVHDGEVFVANFGRNCVSVFSHYGKLLRTIGTKGTGPGGFICTTGVVISPEGELYVTDRDNRRIQVLTTQGVHIREFGNGQLKCPQKLQLSVDKHVLVADEGNNRVAIFNRDGVLIRSVHCAESPAGLAVDHRGDLLVACCSGECVRIF